MHALHENTHQTVRFDPALPHWPAPASNWHPLSTRDWSSAAVSSTISPLPRHSGNRQPQRRFRTTATPGPPDPKQPTAHWPPAKPFPLEPAAPDPPASKNIASAKNPPARQSSRQEENKPPLFPSPLRARRVRESPRSRPAPFSSVPSGSSAQ